MKNNFVPHSPFTTPVLFLIFNRPDTTQKVFGAIKKAKPKQLFVAADGPREDKEGEKEKCKQARKVMEQIDWDCKVKTLFRDKNLGCKIAVSSAIDWFFENVEEGIILEDDCLPSQSFFWFCEILLEKYKDDMRVWHIGGCNFQDGIKRGETDYYFSAINHIWGWASWASRWRYYNVELNQIKDDNFLRKYWKGKFLNYWENILNRMKNKEIDTWDYQWLFTMWYNDGLAILPNKNMISNIGFGVGARSGIRTPDKNMNREKYEIDISHITYPPLIERNMGADEYSMKEAFFFERKIIYRFVKKTKNLLNIFFKTLIGLSMKYLKQFIKDEFPAIFNILKKIYKFFSKKKIVNYFGTNYKKNTLLSYITHPFIKGQKLSHTSYFEVMSHAKILNELGFNVDIVDYYYDKYIDFSKYNVLVGFGEAFVKYFELGYKHLKTIHYGTGMEICFTNYVSLKRIKDVYSKKGVWLFNSARYIEKSWMPQVTLADAILALGNEICVNSYKKYSNAPIYPIPGLFYRTQDAYKILQDRNMSNSKTNFLWFGSSGLVRKGLDLALEVFYRRADLTLHICGPIKNEPDFEKVYFKELYQTENIITYGFVDITSDVFAKILKTCAFVIFPSCMEGGSPSTLTAIGNGALIPIITKETTISTGNEIWIEDFTPEAVEEAVNKALSLGEDEIIKMQKENLEYVLKHNSQENYYRELKNAIEEILGYKK